MKLAVLTALAAVTLGGCSPLDESDLNRLALPIAGSDRSIYMWNLWLGTWIAVLVVFVLVFGMILYAPIRYRRKNDEAPAPSQVRYNLPLEALYTIAPVILVATFFFHTVESQNAQLREVANPDHTVEVVGSKWQWTFNYLDGGPSGETVFDEGDTANLPELWLPVNESVKFELVSPDVIHSFWVPEFYFKMDVVPGKIPGKDGSNSFTMTPNREGVFTGRCAELCGVYHTRMLFKLHVVSAKEFKAHLAELEEKGQIGRPQGAISANTVAGVESNNESGSEH
ncbi:MAG TPA: cytochrome c oxidase subunit II [Aeromicrobium sp.]|nr:cytochrome c oxidase subunit II [Aeromicrobium sp.]